MWRYICTPAYNHLLHYLDIYTQNLAQFRVTVPRFGGFQDNHYV